MRTDALVQSELGASPLSRWRAAACALLTLATVVSGSASMGQHFPERTWESRDPGDLGLDADVLERLATLLEGRGCVIKDGFLIKSWGDQGRVSDVLSSAKPVLSTLLFFAIEEGLVRSVDQPVADFGWDLREKDQSITFRHLGAMTSGYARPEGVGEAWAYNDYAIQLYQRTLFDRVFRDEPGRVATDRSRLGALEFEDGLRFTERARMSASVRDFARIVWFWVQRGRWRERQLLPERHFEVCFKPQVPRDLAVSRKAPTDDYLAVGSYGGGSEHFTRHGPGIYGFNWWFNARGGLHPESLTWPDAPTDTFMSIGAGGNNAAAIPSRGLVLVCFGGNWREFQAGDASSIFNRALALLSASSRPGKGKISNPTRHDR